MALTNTAENLLIDWFYRGEAAPTLPTDWYVGLFSVAPTDTGGGTEVSGNNYARVGITRSLTAMSGTQGSGSTTASTGTSGQSSNNAVVTFAAASGNWGTVVAAGLFSAQNGGTLWKYSTLASSRTVQTGDIFQFPIGQLIGSFD